MSLAITTPTSPLRAGAAALVLAGLTCAAQAASISLSPASVTSVSPNTTMVFDLSMNFSAAEATLGGGIDLDLIGPVSFVSFTPSSYMTGTADPAFTGHGTTHADADYEIHFGNFGGLSGNNLIGTITVVYQGPGTATLALAANSYFGGFYGVNSAAQAVSFNGATINAVPEPATTALWLLGAAALVAKQRRRR